MPCCGSKKYKDEKHCPICKQIPNPDGIKHYKEVMAESFSKGIFGKKPAQLDESQVKVVVKAIKEDQKENKGQMKKYK